MTDISESPTAERAEKASPRLIVDALKTVAGNPARTRASFAKGFCVSGTFEPGPDAASITSSKSFTDKAKIMGRFSVGGGNPHVADTNNMVLRGFSIRLVNDVTSDFLFESAPVHFARTLDQMLAFLRARAPGPDGKPDAARVKAFSEANPETLNQAKYVASRQLPASFASTVYWGVHSFPATNSEGRTRHIKFKILPVGGERTYSEEQIAELGPDFLRADLEARICSDDAKFDIFAVLDAPGDDFLDITQRWAGEDERPTILLGRMSIATLDLSGSCDENVFDPSNIAAGIGEPPDELFAARSPAYRISLSKRLS